MEINDLDTNATNGLWGYNKCVVWVSERSAGGEFCKEEEEGRGEGGGLSRYEIPSYTAFTVVVGAVKAQGMINEWMDGWMDRALSKMDDLIGYGSFECWMIGV